VAPDPRRAALDDEVLEWMREDPWRTDDVRFDALALRLFAFQYRHCEPYRRFCDATGAAPSDVDRWQDVPAVPTGAFKELRIASFPPDAELKVFRTSGTATERRGALHLDTLALYEGSLLPTLRRLLLPELEPGERTTLRVLAPSPSALPDSSLSHMFGCLMAAHGDAHSGYDVRDDRLDVEGLLKALDPRRPVALLGTAFAFVHLLDALEAAGATRGRGPGIPLAPGSRVMETGGFKGRAREVPREELHAAIAATLGVERQRIVNQYGMTELGSQFYDSALVDPRGPRRKLGPPWVRVRLVDPATGADVAPGEPGMIHVFDLANTGSVCAIQTADLGRAVDGEPPGFEVLGRLAGAEERGCSIAADRMLGDADLA
jgi:acyl-CoA synthetase (AMP-forming)/AMP-acid ligase II